MERSNKKGVFLVQMGISAHQKMNSYHWEKNAIDSFVISVIRDTTVLFTHKNFGNIFSEELKRLLKSIQIGDKILVFYIRTKH